MSWKHADYYWLDECVMVLDKTQSPQISINLKPASLGKVVTPECYKCPLVFQVLAVAAEIFSVEFTVTPINITVPTITKLKLLTRFARRTQWWLLRRSREYEEDSGWLEMLAVVDLKSELQPNLLWRNYPTPVICYFMRSVVIAWQSFGFLIWFLLIGLQFCEAGLYVRTGLIVTD